MLDEPGTPCSGRQNEARWARGSETQSGGAQVRPRILFIAPWSFKYSQNANAIQQPLQLGREGRVTLVTARGVSVPGDVAAACEVVTAGSRAMGTRGWRQAFLYEVSATARSWFREGRGVVVSGTDGLSFIAGWWVAGVRRRPWVCLCWDHPLGSKQAEINKRPGLGERIRKGLVRVLSRRARVIALFAPEGLSFLGKKPGEMEHVRNGVLFEELKEIGDQAKQRDDLIVALGYVSGQKGMVEILEAYEQVWQTVPGARLRLVGDLDPAFERELESRRRALPAGAQVEVTGLLPFEDAMRAAAEGAVGVVAYPDKPWLRYNEVLKVGEYQALGVAVVALDSPGLRAMLGDEESVLRVAGSGAGALAEGVTRVLQNPALRESLVQRGRADASKRAWPSVGEKVMKVVRATLESA